MSKATLILIIFAAESAFGQANVPPSPLSGSPVTESSPPTIPPSPRAMWHVTTTKSAIDDSESIKMILFPNESDGSRGGSLVVRLIERKIDVLINGGGYIGVDRPKITLRWDSQTAQDFSWESAHTGDAAFAPKPCQFVHKMMKSTTLAVRVHEFRAPTTLVFDVSRFNEAIEKLPLLSAAATKGLKAENVASGKTAAENARINARALQAVKDADEFLKRERAKERR